MTLKQQSDIINENFEYLDNNKQDNLVSGVNIKTINNRSILGSGNIHIEGGSGVSDYTDLDNLPQINSVTLLGNKTLEELGIQEIGNYALLSDIPKNTSDLNNDSDFITSDYHDSTKQDTIEDLEQIRINAQTGANLVTQVGTNTTDIGDLKLGKQNITDNTLVTLDKTVTGAINELVAKIREIELFKSPNVLQEGEPTINNGQVTGFSKTDYLILPFEFNPKDRAFELTDCFRTGTDVTTPQNIFGSKFSIASYISNRKLTVRISSNGTSWDILDLTANLDIQPNTTYYTKLIFNRLSYTVKLSTDGVEYSEIGSVVDTRPPFAGDVYIGIGNNQNNPFLGMINLHKWELKYNNVVFWEGMYDAGLSTRADISLSNLDEIGEKRFTDKQDVIEDLESIRTNANLMSTKQDIIDDLTTIRSNASTGANLAPQVEVNTQRIEDLTTSRIPDVIYRGTPKITGGQISNFSTENYLLFPFEDISRSLPFDIYFSFTTDDDVQTQQNILDSKFGIALAILNGKGVMALSSNGTSWDIGSVTGNVTLSPNTTYYVKYSWSGTEYKTYISTNNTFDTTDMVLPSTLSPFKTTIYIGGCDQQATSHTPHPFKGIINFTKSRVDVNGITVWEGMADVGIASRANVSLNNLDEVGEGRFNAKQDKLISGDNISIDPATNTISVTGDLGAKVTFRKWGV